MGMRLAEGVDLTRYPEARSSILSSNIKELVDIGMIAQNEDRLQVTQQGRPVLNAVLRGLLDA